MVVEARSPAGEVRTATGKELKVLYNVERYGELLERYSNWERIESPLPDRRGGEGGGDSNWERIESVELLWRPGVHLRPDSNWERIESCIPFPASRSAPATQQLGKN